MIITHATVARALEAAEAHHLHRQVAAWRKLGDDGAQAIVTMGGIAAFTQPLFGRKLNHVTGAGMNGPVHPEDLERVETAYAERGLATEIDLCPHADAGVLPLLASRGYAVDAFSNTYARTLDDLDARAAAASSGIEILQGAAAAAAFVDASIAGFSVQAQHRPRELLDALARIALARDDTSLFVALVDGQVAGSAGLAVAQTPLGPVGELYIASTLPAFRGRGVQTALLQARLVAAKAAGCVLACVTARPANVSARNTERAGFRLAFTKATFVRPPRA